MLSSGHACVLQYSLLHLTGYDLGLEDLEAVPPVGLAHARPPRARAHARHRGHDRAARAGLRQRRRHGDRRALPGRALQPPGHEIVDHHTYVICSDGDMMEGDQPGGGLDRRALRAGQADRLLRRQPHHDRRHDGALLRRRGPRRAPGGRRLARAARRGLRGPRRARGRDRGRARRSRAPVVHRDPLAHRLPGAARRGHRQVARLAARRGRGARHQGGDGLRPRRALLGGRARLRAHVACATRGAAAQAEWKQRFDAWREAFPELAEDWDRAWAGRLRDGWREALPSFEAGEQIATRAAGQKAMAAFARVRARR